MPVLLATFLALAAQATPAIPPVSVVQANPATATLVPATVRVALLTSEGRIVVELENDRAPITTANFLRYVDGHRLDGITFYRAVRVQPDFGFVQFGVQNAPRRVLPPIRHEPTTQTGIHHTDGAISIARYAPGTASGDFTISVGDQRASLDADPSRPGDNVGYAAFGHVVEGMDVVHRILDAPKATGGHFPGEMIASPVTITTARRVTPAVGMSPR